jgi:hypothetical protein
MFSRREFCRTSAGAATALLARRASAQQRNAIQNCPTEWSYQTGKRYADPFHEIELDVVFTLPSGAPHRVPAFWAGESTWRVRYAPPVAGRYSFHTIASDTSNRDLHGQTGTLTVSPYSGANALYKHGMLRISEDRRHFVHSDGTPFFWLGDTWWMGLCSRLSWPDGFQALTADRVRKGFSVVQIVAGLYPDMPAFDPRGENEAGFPWEKDYATIHPAYFDMADLRIAHLVDNGIAPCIVGCWGYFLPQMGLEKMKRHWRYLVARWGAYPAIWCLCGEATMPFYLSTSKAHDAETQKHGWTEIARYVRSIDPLRHPITLHPSRSARESVDDASVLDFDMLQTGHDDRRSARNTIETLNRSLAADPKMPSLVGEVCYEGIQEASREEVQRYMFWSCLLSGAAGHTYGANGIWQVNTPERPYGLSPHGHSWGGPPWNVAAELPGSRQLGLGKGLLLRYGWQRLDPAPELLETHWTRDDYWQPFAAQIPGEAIIAFTPTGMKALRFRNLPSFATRAYLFNPSDGTEVPLGTIAADGSGIWKAPEFPIFRDWVMVLDRFRG